MASWNDSFLIGVKIIDDQHKKLFGMVDEFYLRLADSNNEGPIIMLVKGLKEYSRIHFSTEEMLMEKYAFPGIKSHKASHVSFVNQVAVYEAKLKGNGVLMPMEMAKFLKNWIAQHVASEDKLISAYLDKIDVKKNYM